MNGLSNSCLDICIKSHGKSHENKSVDDMYYTLKAHTLIMAELQYFDHVSVPKLCHCDTLPLALYYCFVSCCVFVHELCWTIKDKNILRPLG